MFGNNPTLRFPGNLMQVRSINELRSVSPYEMNDEAAILVTGSGLFTFDASSMANDNGSSVIRPDGFTPLQSGRWVQPGPQTEDNTFSTLAALQASGLDVAYLIGDPSEPDGVFINGNRQGSGGIGFMQSGVGSVASTMEKKARETVSAGDFGAIGDGVIHPLSERYASLAAAQAVYPFVTALTQTIDYAALQAGLNAVENKGRLIVPPGRYRIGSDSLITGNYCQFQGVNRGGDNLGFGSIIESDSTTAPILTNKYTANVAFVQIRDLAFKGGGYAIRFFDAVSISGLIIERIDTRGCAIDDLHFNRLEVSKIADCFLLSGSRTGWALNVVGFAQNGNKYEFNRCTAAGLGVWNAGQGAEGCHWIGGSWEAGGQLGRPAMNLDGTVVPVRDVSFYGVYFENIPEFLIKARGIVQNVKFEGCRFSGSASASGSLVPVKFDVGTAAIEFGSNNWNEDTVGPTLGPINMVVQGVNSGLSTGLSNTFGLISRGGGDIGLRLRSFLGSPTIGLYTLIRESDSASATNSVTMAATLTLTATGTKAGTTTPVVRTSVYEITYVAPPGGGFSALTVTERTAQNDPALSFVLGLSSAATSADATLAVTGFDGFSLVGSLKYRSGGRSDNGYIIVVLP